MTPTLYELRGRDGRSFSPFCWRARMALAHKGVVPELRKVLFTDIPQLPLAGGTVPILVVGDTVLRDSWDIAEYLDASLPDAPLLFPTEGDARMARFVHEWVVTQIHGPIFKAIAADIWAVLDPADQPYFRATREKRLGMPLEQAREMREAAIAALRLQLAPARSILQRQQYFGGAQPAYADYILFGALEWPRVVGVDDLLLPDDPIQTWFDRCSPGAAHAA